VTHGQGETALQMAAAKGSVVCSRLLLDAGFGDVDARDHVVSLSEEDSE
jgi:hypothetical protein